MSFTIFDKFKGVLDSIPDAADRSAMALAIIEYGLTGAEPEFGYPMSAIFEGMREDIDCSRTARQSNKGGRPKGSRNKPKPAPAPDAEVSDEVSENGKNGGSENQKPPFFEEETPVSETGNPIQDRTIQDSTVQDKEDPLPPSTFPWLCLKALCDELGTTYTTMPGKCSRMLERSEGRFTVEQVRAMVAYKRDEWRDTRFKAHLTPNFLFSPDHFEQCMNQSMSAAEERGRYAVYD